MNMLAAPFRAILKGIQAVIGRIAFKDHSHATILVRIHHHLNHTIQRVERLLTHWHNNTLPKSRTRPGRPSRPRTTPRLPTGQAWLIRNIDHHHARAYASQLQHLLTTPEYADFLAAVPPARRILRPLTRALGIQMPGAPPPPTPKPKHAPKPPPNPWLPPPVQVRPVHELIGIRVLTPYDPQHPDFSKTR